MGLPVGQPDVQIKIGTTWLTSFAGWGDLAWSYAMPGGCREASWTTQADYSARLNLLVAGATVQLYWGGWMIWSGTLAEPEFNGREVACTANGLFRLGENYDNLNGFNSDTTDNPTTAVTAAISRGLPWSIDTTTVPNASLGTTGTSDAVNTITALLDAHADRAGTRWYVDQFGVLRFATTPTVPSYHVRAGTVDLGIALDTYASNVVLRFNNITTGTFGLASYPTLGSTPVGYAAKYGHKEWVKDITDQPPMTQATANTIAQQVYTKTYQKPGWTNAVAPGHGELLTAMGQPIHAASVDAFNRLLRVHGVRDEVAGTDFSDVVVAQTDYTLGEDDATITPVGLSSRQPEDVLTELLEAIGATA